MSDGFLHPLQQKTLCCLTTAFSDHPEVLLSKSFVELFCDVGSCTTRKHFSDSTSVTPTRAHGRSPASIFNLKDTALTQSSFVCQAITSSLCNDAHCFLFSLARKTSTTKHLGRMTTVPEAQLVTTEYLTIGCDLMTGGAVVKEGSLTSYLTALRPHRAGGFGRSEIELLERLIPHLQTALRLGQKILKLEAYTKAVVGALDHISGGVLIVEKNAQPVEMNQTARLILGRCDGLSLVQGILRASTSNATQQLRALIQDAVRAATAECILGSGGVLRIPRPSLKRPFQVLVAPLLAPTSGPPRDAPAAVVFVKDPEAETTTDCKLLSDLFGLTGAESRLAAALMNGASV